MIDFSNSATTNTSFHISNIDFSRNDAGRYFLQIANIDIPRIYVTNCNIYSRMYNIYCSNVLEPRVAVTNSILVTGEKGGTTLYSNIVVTGWQRAADPDAWFNGYWHFENVRFVMDGRYIEGGTDTADHIYMDGGNYGKVIATTTFSNCKFWTELGSQKDYVILRDIANSGTHFIETIGTSIGNFPSETPGTAAGVYQGIPDVIFIGIPYLFSNSPDLTNAAIGQCIIGGGTGNNGWAIRDPRIIGI
jgi:hypothetical protein